jgi:hypothetical protein
VIKRFLQGKGPCQAVKGSPIQPNKHGRDGLQVAIQFSGDHG